MSSLRARCPDCRTLTAVAIGPEYECHACGRQFAAGLVRVPRAWAQPGEPAPGWIADGTAEAARMGFPYPETAVIDEATLEDQTNVLAASLPERPVVVGGCCCAHVGAARGLAARGQRLGVVWIDAHGDLNTPETSPSGNLWGMPFRMLLDGGVVRPEDAALIGARNLDPGELEYLAKTGIDDSVDRAVDGVDAVYIAFDVDVLDPSEAESFMPEPNGLAAADVEAILRDIATRSRIAGMGVTAFRPSTENLELITRLLVSAGL